VPDTAPAGLSRERVVDRAVTIADAEGLEAVTIRRLATDFGVTPMALYWHVKNKDELLAAMGDRLFAGVELGGLSDELSGEPSDEVPNDRWADQLRGLLESLVAAMRRHPSLLPLAFERVMQCEDGRAITEYALGLLRGAGFSVRESANIAAHALRTSIMLVLDEPGREIGQSAETKEEHVRAKRAQIAALPPDRYPNIIAAVDDLIGCADQEGYDQLGLGLFIAGVEALSRRYVTV
jgi:TetR/AcrR family tetracycline transcriptional repressor